MTDTAFHQARPVLLTSLVNKSGAIGLSLLPMLLVDGHYSTAQSSLAMSFVKGSTIVATLAAGWCSDSFGLRPTVLVSFLLAALGLGFLPVHFGFVVLLVSGIVAQLGITSINATLRLLLTKTVERHHQKEALGWMRFTNNLGQVLSFGLGSATASLGALLLIWFDSLTSFLAFLIGIKILAKGVRKSDEESSTEGQARSPGLVSGQGRLGHWGPFIGCTLLMTGWTFMYEFFMDGVAGRLKVLYPQEGLRIFSLLMVTNTVLCAALAVVASRLLSRVIPSFVAGVLLMSSGMILSILNAASVPWLFLGTLLMTLGEIVYGALGQFLLIRAVPPSARENSVYSWAILVANLGRMTAAGLAFPLIVHASRLAPAVITVIGVAVVSLGVLAVQRRELARLGES